MHKLYKIISYFLIPLIKINTFIRILNKKEDKIRYKERFGFTNLQKPWEKNLFGFMLLVLENLNLVIF
jgi:3-deoxy-D-manno-octulosonic-acid transferase